MRPLIHSCTALTDRASGSDAVGQFLVNELAHEAVYRQISPEKRANLTNGEQTTITLGCGITAVLLFAPA